MAGKVRLALRRTFLTGDGELRQPGGVALVVVLLALIALLEVLDSAPVGVYLALFGTLGYVVGERKGSAQVHEVEPVAPPYIPSEG